MISGGCTSLLSRGEGF